MTRPFPQQPQAPWPPPQQPKRHQVLKFVSLTVAAMVGLFVVVGIIGAALGSTDVKPTDSSTTPATPAPAAPQPAPQPVTPTTTQPVAPAPVAPPPAAPTTSEEPDGHTVVYQVRGNGTGMLTYTSDNHMSMAQSTSKLPWSKTLHFDDSLFSSLHVHVMRGMEGGSGPLSCKILVDGKVVTENTSDGGQFASVSCSGSL